MGGSIHGLFIEARVATAFLAVTIVGFKYSLWFVVATLEAYGIFDVPWSGNRQSRSSGLLAGVLRRDEGDRYAG
jgi:hypothetical protein